MMVVVVGVMVVVVVQSISTFNPSASGSPVDPQQQERQSVEFLQQRKRQLQRHHHQLHLCHFSCPLPRLLHPTDLSVRWFVGLCFYLFVYLFVCLFVCLFVYSCILCWVSV